MGGNGEPAKALDADHRKLKKTADDKHGGPAPKNGAAPAPAGDSAVLHQFLADTKAEVGSLTKDKLDHVLAPDAVIAASCKKIRAGFHAAEQAITNVSDEEQAQVARELDAIMTKLFQIGRRYKVLMREAGLESVFDAEDALLHAAQLPYRYRAEGFYDEGGGQQHGDKTTDAGSMSIDLKSGGEPKAQPTSRQELLSYARGLASDLNDAMQRGYADAESIIKEPNQPKKPDMLEELAKMAANMAIGYFNGILTGIVTKAFNKAWGAVTAAPEKLDIKTGTDSQGRGGDYSHLGEPRYGHLGPQSAGNLAGGGTHIEEHDAGHEAGEKPIMVEALLETFKDGAKEGAGIVKKGIDEKLAPEEKKEEGIATNQSGKSIYLKAARDLTGTRLRETRHKFQQADGEFKRMPVERLKAVAEAFNASTFSEIQDGWRETLITNWVNFGKDAAEKGEDVRDPSKRPNTNSKLDPTYGVLEIQLTVTDGHHFQFTHAQTPFLGDAVLSSIRSSPHGLGDLHLHRKIHVFDPARPGRVFGFTVDPDGKVTADLSSMSAEARVMWANLRPDKGPGGKLDDGEVYAGMYTVLDLLKKIPASRISDLEWG